MENRFASPNQRLPSFSSTLQSPHRNSILSNISNTFQRTQISTSRGKDQSTNRNKSKIKALPNYTSHNFSGAMPFITVFQCIEIERLSQEIQVQRARLHQAQKQAFNAINYEVQIQQLSQKCTNYEAQIKQYQSQLSKMNKICESLYHDNEDYKQSRNSELKYSTVNDNSNERQVIELKNQIDNLSEDNQALKNEINKWKQKYEESEIGKARQFQKIREMMENQRKSMLNREIKDLEAKHQNQLANLNIQIKRLVEELELKDVQINDFKAKAQKTDDYIRQLHDYGNKLNQYQGRISQLNQQHLRLSNIVDNSSLLLNNARKKQFELSKRISTDQQIIVDNNYLKQTLAAKQQQIETWKQNIVVLQEQLSKTRQVYLMNEELEAKLGFLKDENVRLNSMGRERLSEIEKWKKMALQLEDEVYKLKEKQFDSVDREAKEKILQVENQRVSNILKVRTDELQELKEKWRSSQGTLTAYSRLQRELKSSEQKYKAQLQRNKKLQQYIEELQSNANAQASFQLKQQDLQQKLKFQEQQNQGLRRTIGNLQTQICEHKKADRTPAQELNFKKQTLEFQQNNQKINLLSQEIERLNDLLKQKNTQITKLEDEQIKKFNIANQCQKLQEMVHEKQDDVSHLKQQLSNCMAKMRKYQSQTLEAQQSNTYKMNEMINRERILADNLEEMTNNYDKVCKNYSELQKNLQEINLLQKNCQKLQNRITVHLRDIDLLKSERDQNEQLLQQQRLQGRQLREQISNLEHKIRMNGLTNSQVGQPKFSTSRIKNNNTSQTAVNQLMQKIVKLQSIIYELRSKYEQMLNSVASTAVSQEENNSGKSRNSQNSQFSSTSSHNIFESQVSRA